MIVIKVLFFLTSILSKPGKNWAWAKLKFPYKNMPCSCQCGETFFPLGTSPLAFESLGQDVSWKEI